MIYERQKGVAYSLAFHFVMLILAITGLPSFMLSEPPQEPLAITVELLPITGITNVRPSEKPPAPEEKPKEKPEKEKPKPSPPVKTSEPVPAPKAETPKPKEKEKPAEKKPEPKKEEKKKPKEDDLAAVLRAVKETAQKESKEKKKDKDTDSSASKSMSSQFDPTMQLSMSEKDAIMSQIAKCWSVPAGARNAHELVVVLDASFNSDGSLISVSLASQSRLRYGADSFFRAAADSAIRAVKLCSPLQGLPTERYNGWREMELHFDPKYMLF